MTEAVAKFACEMGVVAKATGVGDLAQGLVTWIARPPRHAWRARSHRSGRRKAALPAPLLARLQSDRAALRQTQSVITKGRRALGRRPLEPHRSSAPRIHT